MLKYKKLSEFVSESFSFYQYQAFFAGKYESGQIV